MTAKGFASPKADFHALPDIDLPHPRVQVPTAEYLLAMKVMAARSGIGADPSDKEDIRFLIRWLELTTAEQVFEVVGRYYDPSGMLPGTSFPIISRTSCMNSRPPPRLSPRNLANPRRTGPASRIDTCQFILCNLVPNSAGCC